MKLVIADTATGPKVKEDKFPANELDTFTPTALSGKFEEMQYNEISEFDESPDVSELEALKRSGARRSLYLPLTVTAFALLTLL